MLQALAKSISRLGDRLQNYGYILTYPSYRQVRAGRGCADIYRLLNKPWFPKADIKLILDVGANQGQFIETSLALLPNVPIYAFEPNPVLVEGLNQKYSNSSIKIFPVALGEYPQTRELYVSHFSPSSSLLKGNDQLCSEFPEVTFKEAVPVPVERLDQLLQRSDQNFLLKIDVQGFELDVLKGAIQILNQGLVIVCEVNLVALYEQQCSVEEIIAFLRTHQFHLVDIGNPIRSRHNQEILYLDLAFMRR